MYEYRCDACGHSFEKIQKFSDPQVDVCPSCGERKVQKLLSSPAIQFKGSGFYITDYARKGADGKDSGEKSDTAEKSGTAETKPAATDSKSTSSDSGSSTKSSDSTSTASTTPSNKPS